MILFFLLNIFLLCCFDSVIWVLLEVNSGSNFQLWIWHCIRTGILSLYVQIRVITSNNHGVKVVVLICTRVHEYANRYKLVLGCIIFFWKKNVNFSNIFLKFNYKLKSLYIQLNILRIIYTNKYKKQSINISIQLVSLQVE